MKKKKDTKKKGEKEESERKEKTPYAHTAHLAQSTHSLLADPRRRGLEPAHAVEVRRDTNRSAHVTAYGERCRPRRHQAPIAPAASSRGAIRVPRIYGSAPYGVITLG